MSLRLLLADDEPPARLRLRRLLADLPEVEVIAECGAGDEALRLTGELQPDVALLDIRMPGMSGLEAARHMALLPQPPAIVFTTAYDQYAVEAFEAEAVDYLLKPIRAERLGAALQRAVRLSTVQLARTALARHEARTQLAARLGEQIRLIPVDAVYYFSADQKYTTVRHKGGTDLIDDSLRALEEEFGSRFVRVHRNALAAVDCLERIERDAEGHYSVALRDIGERLDVSRRLAGELKERFGL
jgi:two-component system, LytTR family, response regulator AlgR